MASLPNNTFASPGNPYYALVAGGGGGGGSSLQSPASITPDANGAVTLNMIAADTGDNGATLNLTSTTGGGGANVNITDDTGNSAAVNFQFQAGGNGILQFTGPSTIIAVQAQSLADEGKLIIGASDGTGDFITQNVIVDTCGNRVTLGDPVTAVGTTPLVTVTQPLLALQSVTVQGAAPGTGIILQGSGATPSIIGSGSVTLGTVNHSNIITVEDAPSVGAVVAGALGVQGSALVSGSVTATNVTLTTGSTISTLAGSGGGGTLNISSGYNDSPAAIVINDANVTINRGAVLSSAVTATGSFGITSTSINGGSTLVTNTLYPITNPGAAGLYTIMSRVGDGVAVNVNGQFGVVGYWSGSAWIAGATGLSAPVAAGNMLISFGTSSGTRSQLYLQQTSGASVSAVVVYIIPMVFGLSGVIT